MITRCINKVIIFSKANQKVGELGQTRIIFVFEKLRNFSFFWQKCDNNIFYSKGQCHCRLAQNNYFAKAEKD